MAFDHLNRSQRRAAASYARAEAAKRPARLTQLPRERIAESYPNAAHPPTNVWQSRKYLVQLFDEQPFQSVETRRMTVSRVTLSADGHWEENLQWEELQDIKREIGFGDWYGIEIYPRDRDVVNVANMRHVWLLAVPLQIGWFAQGKDEREANQTIVDRGLTHGLPFGLPRLAVTSRSAEPK